MDNDEKLNQSQRHNESDMILKVLAETVTFLETCSKSTMCMLCTAHLNIHQ